VDAGPGPVGWCADVAVFDRVVVDIVEMRGEVALVADVVLPVSALPDRLFPFFGAGSGCGCRLSLSKGAGEAGFDQHPAGREVVIALGQGPKGVQVVGQDDDGVDGERVALAHYAEGAAQGVDGLLVAEDWPPLEGHYGEKVAASPGLCATVLHDGSVAYGRSDGVSGGAFVRNGFVGLHA